MSKKYRRGRKRKKAPSFWILAGGILLAILTVFGLLQARDSEGVPAIQVSQERIEYGDVPNNIPLSFEITVTNVGNGTLRFRQPPYIEIVEGC
jgi:hypothetical protein